MSQSTSVRGERSGVETGMLAVFHLRELGRPVAGYVANADALIRSQHLALGPPVPSGQQRVCVTHAGLRSVQSVQSS